MQNIPAAIKANIQQMQTLLTDTQALVDELTSNAAVQELRITASLMESERAKDIASLERQKNERTEEAARALFRALAWEK